MTLEKVVEKSRVEIGCIVDRLWSQSSSEAPLNEGTPSGGRLFGGLCEHNK